MSEATDSPCGRQAPVWMIWANPIFRRYCRSRLRTRGLGVTLLITLILAGFIFFFARAVLRNRFGMDSADAERAPLIPLLYLQGLILFILGAGQVAGGITAESDEGVLDYQRLAPMSPLAKTLGYLFGLPVREYVACLATMPFTIWAVYKGGVDPAIAGKLYLAFFVSAILYHLTGLITGTIVKNKRWAFLVSMGVIFSLYTVMPVVAKAGLVYFQYLTISPVYKECLPHLLPGDMGAGMESLNNLLAGPTFFHFHLPVLLLTVGTQLFLIVTGIVMLCRRWRRWESHLLGKGWALGLFVWLQVLLLGNALPLIESGKLFPSQAMNDFGFNRTSNWRPEGMEAVFMVGLYGLVTLVIIWTLILMITPSSECQLRGWRRAHKLRKRRLTPGSDPSSSFVWILCMIATGIAGWWTFSRAVIESHWFPGQTLPINVLAAYSVCFVTGALSVFALLEWRGMRAFALCAILVGVVPVLLALVVGAIGDRMIGVASWFAAISPASGPVFATAATIPLSDLPLVLLRAVPRAFWFWQIVILLVTIRFLLKLRKARKDIARQAEPERER